MSGQHKKNCSCFICKSKRGDTSGKHSPLYKEKILFVCQYCGKIKYIHACRIKTRKYCSQKCHYSAGPTDVTRKNMSLSRLGYKQTEEHRLQNSGKNHPRYGKIGKNNPLWKGQLYQGTDKRWLMYIQEGHSRMRLARYVAEKCLQRKLKSSEIVHHINEDLSDDRPENLYVFANTGKHLTLHRLLISSLLKSNL